MQQKQQKTTAQANTAGRPPKDPEIYAMSMCVRVFDPLDEGARSRVLRHLSERYRIDLEQQ